jgi:ABC-type Fe3+/spermidine/putrescine transport system ATPase subunit
MCRGARPGRRFSVGVFSQYPQRSAQATPSSPGDLVFSAARGRLTTLVGANGAGKTTTLKALVGTIAPWGGRVVFQGEDVTRLPAHAKAARGLVLVPEGRQLFSAMTVEENLEIERAMRPGFQSLQGRRTAQEAVWGLLSLAPKNRFPRARGKRRQRLGSHATETGLHARVPKAIASVIFRYPAPK